ncbi:MAG: CPBP family intramembrane metalloprotease, partial [Candidatus Eremiobacteraeota bacterium]|nr:CPBP family intramembrane metalloprotease [Candidatus Eremiobacteraeota bacterium]
FTSVWAWLFAAFIALIFVGAFAAGIHGSSALSGHALNPVLIDVSIALQFFFEGILVAAVLVVLPRLSKFSLRELGMRVPNAATIGIALAGAVVMAIVADGGASLIDSLAHSKHQQEAVEIFKALHDPTTIGVFAAFAVLFAPFAEETIFRLFFFNFGLRYGGFWAGTTVSAVLFGFAHGDAYEALPLALGGAILCYVYYRTRNAFAPMITHALFNAFSIVALLAVPKLATP